MTNVVSIHNALIDRQKKQLKNLGLQTNFHESRLAARIRGQEPRVHHNQGVRKTHYNYLDTRNAEGRAEWTRRFYGGSWYPDTMSAELRAQHTKAFDAKREAAREFLRGRYGR